MDQTSDSDITQDVDVLVRWRDVGQVYKVGFLVLKSYVYVTHVRKSTTHRDGNLLGKWSVMSSKPR